MSTNLLDLCKGFTLWACPFFGLKGSGLSEDALQLILELSEDCADIAYFNIWNEQQRKQAVMMLAQISTLTELIMDNPQRRPQLREYVYKRLERVIGYYIT